MALTNLDCMIDAHEYILGTCKKNSDSSHDDIVGHTDCKEGGLLSMNDCSKTKVLLKRLGDVIANLKELGISELRRDESHLTTIVSKLPNNNVDEALEKANEAIRRSFSDSLQQLLTALSQIRTSPTITLPAYCHSDFQCLIQHSVVVIATRQQFPTQTFALFGENLSQSADEYVEKLSTAVTRLTATLQHLQHIGCHDTSNQT